MKVVILEGLDGSGKSTIKRIIDNETNYKNTFIDRFTGSTWVYDKYTGRKNMSDETFKFEKKLANDFLLVYCEAPIDIIMERVDEKGDKLTIEMAKSQIKIYNDYLIKTPFKHIRVDTTNTIQETVKQIVKFIESNT